MKKVLLLGGDGQLGTRLRAMLSPIGDVKCTTLTGTLPDGGTCDPLDLTDLDAIAPMIERHAPDIVVNATAHTAVDKAESEPDLAQRINAEAPARIAAACAARDALLVHYSTDYVFDGTATQPLREDDPTAPLGVYGRSKRAGEEAVERSGARHMIFRTAWVYDVHGHNFLRTMLRVGAERDELRVVADQVGSPTPAWLLAEVTVEILRRPVTRSGLWHLTTTGQTSWHGFAEAIFAGAVARGVLPKAPRVVAIPSSEYPTPAARPAYSVLDTTAIRRDFGIALPEWEDALATTLDLLRD
ncbi:NAD(P)-dependent oxidoreductase [Lysobacter helvus]|uniref:dTDP-4-dehydrorhamnose reductase n=2 Tax=Lysobacteraceae TaxID=32033 RepID=A0ABN6FT67_9GAMM|nr:MULTISPECIES: dTDP-4-dehydrorhamnose reductase [Lysobacter]BCT92892.1 NAD(P)-dependent oxidoreductase [Lysobacter caseinilyticus]BCT96045.1 NAD(P)-dependent oxidoreductase [Lysobacter helvus]